MTASKRTKFAPASTPCTQCPWRTENQGKRHSLGWYTRKNVRRLWSGLRRGERMTCHPTDPDNPAAPNGRVAPEGTTTRECAGAQILVQRELQRLGDLIESGDRDPWSTYWAANPKGLTKTGAALVAMNVQWGGVEGLGLLEVGKVNLNDETISHVDLTPWVPRKNQEEVQ